MPEPDRSTALQIRIAAASVLCFMLSSWSVCEARQLSVPAAVSAALQAGTAAHLSTGLSSGRSLLQSSCPAEGQAATGCSRASASDLESYRNILLTQCSTVTPAASFGGCCSALPASGTAAWNTFVHCACSTLASQVGAFVTVSNVLKSCSSSSNANTPASPSPLASSPSTSSSGSPPQPVSPSAGSTSPQASSVNAPPSQPPTPGSGFGLNPTLGSNTLSELQTALGNSPASVNEGTPANETPATGRTPTTPNMGSGGGNNQSPST